MLKSIASLGTVLNRKEQSKIKGSHKGCPDGQVLVCNWLGCWCRATWLDDFGDFQK